MRALYHVAIFALLSLSVISQAAGQWQQVSSPQAGTGSITNLGSELLLSTRNGFYYSADNGASWQAKSSTLTQSISGLAFDGTDLYATVLDSLLYRSTDEGSTWNPVGLPSFDDSARNGAVLAVPGALFIFPYTTHTEEIFRSSDHGNSWVRIDSPQALLPYDHIANGFYQVITVGSRLIAPETGGILISTDNGVTWDTATNIQSSLGYDCIAHIGDTILAGGGLGLAHSTDGGITWSEDAALRSVYSVAAIGSNFYAQVNEAGVYKSSDGGFTWTPWNRGLPDFTVSSLTASGQSLLAGGYRGQWRLPEDTARWQWVGVEPQTVFCFDTTQNAICSGTPSWDFISFDDGTTWNPSTWGLHSARFVAMGDTLESLGGWIASTMLPASALDTTVERWLDLPGFYSLFPVPSFCEVGSMVVEVMGLGSPAGTLLVIPFQASSFYDTVGLSTNAQRTTEAVAWNGEYLFAATRFDGIYRSSDTGKHWIKMSSGFPDNTFASDSSYYQIFWGNNIPTGGMACEGSNVFIASPSGVFRSTDNGASWTNTSQGLPARPIRNIKAFPFGLVASADSGDIYFSADNGNSWHDKSDGLAPATVYAFQQFQGDLYISNADGIFRRPIPEVLDGVSTSSAASQLEMQVPNPVFGSANVQFTTVNAGPVELRVYDLLGREVASLVRGFYVAGSYHAILDASPLVPGTYFLQLLSPDGQVSKAITIEN